jgi:hypothetical protein
MTRRRCRPSSAPTATPSPPAQNTPATRRRALPTGGWRSAAGRTAAKLLARGSALQGVTQPDHPARLRRGLVRDRQVDRRPARRAPGRGQAAARGALHRLPLRRHLREPSLLREHRPGGCLPPSDHPGLRHERPRPPVGHGAPLRLRVERQLGYKQAKYVMQVEAVASLAASREGTGATGRMRASTIGMPGSDWVAAR